MRFILMFAATMAVSVPCSIFGGFVLKHLWGWFVVPTGLNPISIAQAMGLLTVASIFAAGLAGADADEADSPMEAVLLTVVRFMTVYVTAGLFGWLYHFFL